VLGEAYRDQLNDRVLEKFGVLSWVGHLIPS